MQTIHACGKDCHSEPVKTISKKLHQTTAARCWTLLDRHKDLASGPCLEERWNPLILEDGTGEELSNMKGVGDDDGGGSGDDADDGGGDDADDDGGDDDDDDGDDGDGDVVVF